MKLKTIISIFITSAAFTFSAYSQSVSNANSFRNLFKPVEGRPEYSLKIETKNEVRLLLTSGFAFYKIFISSQDAVRCTFYPSCSVYAMNTIKTNGLIGVLDAIDRLTRCNGISPEKYHIHEPDQRFYDPVTKIHTHH